MAKQQNTLRSAAEYAGMRFVAGLLSLLPMALGEMVVCLVADVWRALDGRHRNRVVDQAMARLGIDRAAAERLARDNYRHYAIVLLEVAKLRRMRREDIARRTDLNGCDTVLRDLLAEGRGAIVLTGHLGNWEWGCVAMGMTGGVDGAIARPLDNPHIDRYVNDIRMKGGAEVWSKFSCMRKAAATLRRGGGFVAVVDQDAGKRGCMVPFLDKFGSTMPGPVDLAVRCGAPIYVGAVIRAGEPGRFIVQSGRVHRPRPGADPAAERIRLLTEVNADLSAIIRKHPEQWIWIHKRWKTAAAGAVGVGEARRRKECGLPAELIYRGTARS